MIVGDVNIDAEKYNIVNDASNYINTVASYGCKLYIDSPTRVYSTGASCLDHVYSNFPTSDLESHIIIDDATDHYPTLTKIKGVTRIRERGDIFRRKNKLSKEKWDQFNDELIFLLNQKLSSANQPHGANYIANSITEIYQHLIDKYMPLVKLSRKERRYLYKPWITPAIKVSIDKKKRLFKKTKRKNGAKFLEEYHRYRNLLSRTKKKAYDEYYREKIALYGQNKSKTWNLINEISKRKRSKKSVIKGICNKKGTKLTETSRISNCLNKHFSTIGKDMASKFESLGPGGLTDPLEYIPNTVTHSIELPDTNIPEIIRLILNLDEKKSSGYDLISNRVLKASCHTIAPFLAILFNKCILDGIFPKCFKVAKVIPLFKSGDRLDLNNYRPISLLPCISKVFEKILSIRVLTHFDMFQLFSPCQFGFRESFTTEYAIIDIYEKLLNNLDKGLTSCAIFLDLAKAFDSVSHDILLKKLYKYGIRGNALRLFTSYLEGRSQFVSLNDTESILEEIYFGVPQGSILGPLLFLIYINDLPNATNFFIKLYADDTFLCSQNENAKALESEVNFEIGRVYKWLASNRLTLNIDKSKFMILSRHKGVSENFRVKINNEQMDQCDSYKYLGVYFDKDLNWKKHIEHVCKKISKSCGSISKLRNCLEIETLREVYHALIHSYLRYGIIAWGTASETALQPIKVLMNRAIRIMCFAPLGRIDVQPLYESLEILNIENVYKLELGKFMYKKKNNLLPVSIANYFEQINEPQHGYNLRTRERAPSSLIARNSVYGERSTKIRGLDVWNSIPNTIQTSESPNSFKGHFKSHLLILA